MFRNDIKVYILTLLSHLSVVVLAAVIDVAAAVVDVTAAVVDVTAN